MKNKTIEERAKEYDSQIGRCYNDEGAVDIETLYIEIATEQDRIARADEKERCINAACEWLHAFDQELNKATCGGCRVDIGQFRKAIEKGGNK